MNAARGLGCPRVVIPDTGEVLSAVGALMSNLSGDHAATLVTTSEQFDFDRVNGVLAELGRGAAVSLQGPAQEPSSPGSSSRPRHLVDPTRLEATEQTRRAPPLYREKRRFKALR